jgi:hypothetical protein
MSTTLVRITIPEDTAVRIPSGRKIYGEFLVEFKSGRLTSVEHVDVYGCVSKEDVDAVNDHVASMADRIRNRGRVAT